MTRARASWHAADPLIRARMRGASAHYLRYTGQAAAVKAEGGGAPMGASSVARRDVVAGARVWQRENGERVQLSPRPAARAPQQSRRQRARAPPPRAGRPRASSNHAAMSNVQHCECSIFSRVRSQSCNNSQYLVKMLRTCTCTCSDLCENPHRRWRSSAERSVQRESRDARARRLVPCQRGFELSRLTLRREVCRFGTV